MGYKILKGLKGRQDTFKSNNFPGSEGPSSRMRSPAKDQTPLARNKPSSMISNNNGFEKIEELP